MGGAVYRFGRYVLDVDRRALSHDGQAVDVGPRALEILCHLVEHRDRVVTADELRERVGDLGTAGEAALSGWLRTARFAVGDTEARQQLIRTVGPHRHRFVAPVTAVPAGGADRAGVRRDAAEGSGPVTAGPDAVPRTAAVADGAGAGHEVADSASGEASAVAPAAASTVPPTSSGSPAPAAADHEVIRFCRSADGTRVAYTATGQGPPLVKTANWLTRLDLDRTTPMWAHWFEGLTRGRRLIRYDERGCGLSEWTVPGFALDDLVADLDAVVDAVGLDRFPLLGVSQGGAVAVAYAARRPERVSRLILTSAYARGQRVRAGSAAERDAAEVDLDIARAGWRTQESSFLRYYASQFIGDATPAEWDAFAAYQRQTTSPANALRFLEEFTRIDVASVAREVRCPTLIVHARDDPRVPVAQALELATLIPDSRLILLDGRNHLFTAADPAWPTYLAHLHAFLAEEE
ncbi:alpha/beta fold hydrolase [Streptomyces sp. NPDC048566]|uniref:alpha/beta fold hydrolase n=1 Tax=Streptomyces sp. NPDC048566 TaxID=3365569 RepID=UPI003710D7A4